MIMKYPQLFPDQPEITPDTLRQLRVKGLIVPPTTARYRAGIRDKVTNRTAGEVVGYNILAKKFASGQVSQQDAQLLLVIEATRAKGARKTHVGRLAEHALALSTTKNEVIEKVRAWDPKQK